MKKIFSNLLIKTLAFLLIISGPAAGALSADTLRINLGFWPGERDPGLEQHLFYDDLLYNTGLGRFDLPWKGKDTSTIYPIGLQFIRPAGNGSIVAGINYTRYLPDYSFLGLYPGSGVFSMVDLLDYKATDIEAEVGYEFNVGSQFKVKPKFGGRSHAESYTYNELTLGEGTYIVTLNGGPFESSAQGAYMGVDANFALTPQLSIIGEYAMSAPLFGTLLGSHSGERITAGVIGGSIGYYEYLSEESSYKINFSRFMLGMEYKLNEKFRINAGVRSEEIKESYPEFYSFSYTILAGNNRGSITLPIVEYFTDAMFYGTPHPTTKGVFFVGMSMDIGN